MSEEDIIKAVKAATEIEVSSRADLNVLDAACAKAEELKSRAAARAKISLIRRPAFKALAGAALVLIAFGVTLVAMPGGIDWLLHPLRTPEPGLKLEMPVTQEPPAVRLKGVPGGPSQSDTGGPEAPNDEPYIAFLAKEYAVNPPFFTDEEPVSSFAADLDGASYTIARRFFRDGHLPLARGLRTEEFINYFNYGYAAPADGPLAVYADGAPSPFALYRDKGYQLLRIGIRAKDVAAAARKDANLTIVVDVSGSMAIEDRIALVRKSLKLLVDQLRPRDTVAVVVFDGEARVLLSPTVMEDRSKIISAIESLAVAVGSEEISDAESQLPPAREGEATNIESGIVSAYEIASKMFDAKKINRVILCSDGLANRGKTGPLSILREIQQYPKDICLTTLGFGMGYYNDYLMEQLADKADGQYFYIDGVEEARRVLVEKLTGTLEVVAADVRVSVDFNPDAVSQYRLIGYENRRIADEKAADADGGEIGAGQSMTALYEIKFTKSADAGRIAILNVKYVDPDTRKEREIKTEIKRSAFGESFEKASWDFRLAAAVAEFASQLRGSDFSRKNDFDDILRVLKGVSEERKEDSDVENLVSLVSKAKEIKEKKDVDEADEPSEPDGDVWPIPFVARGFGDSPHSTSWAALRARGSDPSRRFAPPRRLTPSPVLRKWGQSPSQVDVWPIPFASLEIQGR